MAALEVWREIAHWTGRSEHGQLREVWIERGLGNGVDAWNVRWRFGGLGTPVKTEYAADENAAYAMTAQIREDWPATWAQD